MYQTRMIGYYPKAIQSIDEFQAIIDAEHPEIEAVSSGGERIISDSYLLTMSEERIAQWEQLLGIRPLEDSSVEDRRETIIARIRGQGKLNTALIKSIVKTFTNSDCKTWIENSTLYIKLRPPKNGKEYSIDNLTQELASKVPAHLSYDISKAWQYWENVNSDHTNWQIVKQVYGTWEDVLYDQRSKANMLDYSTLDTFYLG